MMIMMIMYLPFIIFINEYTSFLYNHDHNHHIYRVKYIRMMYSTLVLSLNFRLHFNEFSYY